MGPALSVHQAGGPVDTGMHFNRETDRIVHREIGKKPLDVGSDRIARTARAALMLLEQLRQRLGQDIPLAWTRDWKGAAAIEVYPAATLRGYGIPSSDYKKKDQLAQRSVILARLDDLVGFRAGVPAVITNADQLDAVVCVLAGHDFRFAEVSQPRDVNLAHKEGWIWVRRPAHHIEELTS